MLQAVTALSMRRIAAEVLASPAGVGGALVVQSVVVVTLAVCLVVPATAALVVERDPLRSTRTGGTTRIKGNSTSSRHTPNLARGSYMSRQLRRGGAGWGSRCNLITGHQGSLGLFPQTTIVVQLCTKRLSYTVVLLSISNRLILCRYAHIDQYLERLVV